MIDLEFLQSLIEAIDESGLDSLEIERGGTRVRLSKTPPPPPVSAPPGSSPEGAGRVHVTGSGAGGEGDAGGADSGASREPGAAAATAPASNLVDVTSPMVGTFYRAPAPDAPAYVEPGARIGKGDTLCIIEAMKLMNELEAEVSGTVREILVDNGDPVEYGQVLFRVEPA